MKDFDALKDLWSGQTNDPKMDYEGVLKDVRKSGSAMANRLMTESLAMLAGVMTFGWIWLEGSFLLWTTHLSIAILVACCIYYLTVQLTDYRRLSSGKDVLQKPDLYISYLQKYQRERYNFNTRNYKIYSIFIGIALALFAIELYYISPIWQSIICLIFSIGWFIMCWRLMISYRIKEQERINEMITKLERIKKQFD